MSIPNYTPVSGYDYTRYTPVSGYSPPPRYIPVEPNLNPRTDRLLEKVVALIKPVHKETTSDRWVKDNFDSITTCLSSINAQTLVKKMGYRNALGLLFSTYQAGYGKAQAGQLHEFQKLEAVGALIKKLADDYAEEYQLVDLNSLAFYKDAVDTVFKNELLGCPIEKKAFSITKLALKLLGIGAIVTMAGVMAGSRPEPKQYNTDLFSTSINTVCKQIAHKRFGEANLLPKTEGSYDNSNGEFNCFIYPKKELYDKWYQSYETSWIDYAKEEPLTYTTKTCQKYDCNSSNYWSIFAHKNLFDPEIREDLLKRNKGGMLVKEAEGFKGKADEFIHLKSYINKDFT